MGLFDNLDLSKFLAPAGYAPDVPPPVGGINMFAGLGNGYAPPPQGPPPGGPTQSVDMGPPPSPPPAPLAAQMPNIAPTANALNPTPGFTFNQGPQPPPVDDGSQGLLTGGGPDEAPAPQGGLRGLLSRLTATNPETGRTFADRLMAVGQIMQGDTPGAQAYLEKQQEKVINQRAVALKQQIAQRQAQAFSQAFDANGQFNPAKYAQLVGGAFDVGDMAKLYEQMGPKYQFVTGRRGDVGVGNLRSGAYQEEVSPPDPTPKAPGRLILKPGGDADNPEDWVPNQAYEDALEREARAKRLGAPPVGRASRAPPKADQAMQDWAAHFGIKVTPRQPKPQGPY